MLYQQCADYKDKKNQTRIKRYLNELRRHLDIYEDIAESTFDKLNQPLQKECHDEELA